MSGDSHSHSDPVESDLRTLIRNLPSAFIALDRNWSCIDFNAGAEKHGMKREHLGRNIWHCFPEWVGTRFWIEYHRVMRDRIPTQFEDLYQPTGSWYRVLVCPRADGGINLVFDDTTAQRKITEEMKEGEARLSIAIQGAQIGTFDWNVITNRRVWSEQAERIFGFEPGTFPGSMEAFVERIHPVDRGLMQQALEEAFQKKKDYSADYRVVWPSGQVRWVSSRGRGFYGPDEKPLRMLGIMMDITDRKVLEHELRSSEEHFRSLAEAIPQLVWTATTRGDLDYVNRRCLEYTGTHKLPQSVERWMYAVHPEDLAEAVRYWQESVRCETAFETEFRLRRADGVYHWFLGRAVPIRDDDGQVLRWLGTATDIEDYKNLMFELRQSRDQLDVILKGVADGISVLDADGNFVYANEIGARLCGYSSAEEFINATTAEIMASMEVRDEQGELVDIERLPSRRALEGDRHSPEMLLQIKIKKTGFIQWVIVSSKPVFDENGKVKYAISIFRDFTPRKRMEDSLRLLAESGAVLTSSLDYKTVLRNIAKLVVPSLADWCLIAVKEPGESMPQSVAVVHSDPEKQLWAEEMSKTYPTNWDLPYGPGAVIRSGKSELYSDAIPELFRNAARSEEHFQAIHQIGLKSSLIVPLKTQRGTIGALTLISAESGRRYTEADLRIAEDLAFRAGIAVENSLLYRKAQEAVQSRDEFLSIASHELKTPITSLKMQLQMARRDATTPRLVRSLDVSAKQVDRLTALIEDLLDVTKIRAGRLSFNAEEFDFSELVREVVDRFSDQVAAARCSLELQLLPGVCGVWDRNRMEQVVINLISNAIKYAAGSPIRIQVDTQVGRGSAHARLVVQDFGDGIPLERQERIFERFERATVSRSISGLGLGLFIVKQIVEAHEGKVRVDSELGKGASFIVELPLPSTEPIRRCDEKNIGD